MINVNMTDKAGVTLATAGKYCADNVKVTPSAEILRKDEQVKTATPTTSAQDITPDAGKALSKVTVNPITAAIVGNLDASSFAPSIVAAIEGKGVTVPDATLLDGMAALIESIEAGGGGRNFDWRGFPILTGTFTPSSDISSNYMIELPEGERLHYKNVSGSGMKWKPMFLLFPDIQFRNSRSTGYIQNIGSFPNVGGSINDTPNNTGTIFAYTDGTSVNTTYVKGIYDVSIGESGVTNGSDYQEVTILSVKIPCTSSLKLMAGLTYRWMLFASIYAEEVTIV